MNPVITRSFSQLDNHLCAAFQEADFLQDNCPENVRTDLAILRRKIELAMLKAIRIKKTAEQ